VAGWNQYAKMRGRVDCSHSGELHESKHEMPWKELGGVSVNGKGGMARERSTHKERSGKAGLIFLSKGKIQEPNASEAEEQKKTLPKIGKGAKGKQGCRKWYHPIKNRAGEEKRRDKAACLEPFFKKEKRGRSTILF